MITSGDQGVAGAQSNESNTPWRRRVVFLRIKSIQRRLLLFGQLMAMRHPVPAMDEKVCLHEHRHHMEPKWLIGWPFDVADGRERGVEYLFVNKSEVVLERCPAKAHAPHGGEDPVK